MSFGLKNLLADVSRRSIENPAVPLSDPDDFTVQTFGGGSRSTSGILVNPETVLGYPAVWRAVHLIARDVAKVPTIVYRRSGEGKERDTAHPAFSLLKYRPNLEQAAFFWKLNMQAVALLRGNSYSRVLRDGLGRSRGLVQLPTPKTKPVRRKGKLVYETVVRMPKGEEERKILDPSDVIHIRGYGEGLEGKSAVAHGRNSLGVGIAAQRFAGAFFKNGATAKTWLRHPETLSDEAAKRMRDSFGETYIGSQNWHRPYLLEEGLEVANVGMNMEDAQFLESRQFEIREVANWFGVPPHKLGDTTRTSFSSLEQENQAYLDDSLDPWLVAWESELREKLLLPAERDNDTHVIEFLRVALIRTNVKDRGKFYNFAIMGGWMSRNEVRARENMNPFPGGDEFLEPLNMTPVGRLEREDEIREEVEEEFQGKVSEDELEELVSERLEEDLEAESPASAPHLMLLVDLFSRMAARVSAQAQRQAKKPDTFIGWIDGLSKYNMRTFVEAATPILEAIRSVADGGITEEALGELFFEAARGKLLEATDVSPRALAASVKDACRRLEVTIPSSISRTYSEGLRWKQRDDSSVRRLPQSEPTTAETATETVVDS